MSVAFSADLRHFLDEKGSVPDTIPEPAKALANYIGSIVSSVSSDSQAESIDTDVKCHPAPKQKKCFGKIVGFLDYTSMKIHWECPTCGNQGVIIGWEGTLWDRSADQQEQAN